MGQWVYIPDANEVGSAPSFPGATGEAPKTQEPEKPKVEERPATPEPEPVKEQETPVGQREPAKQVTSGVVSIVGNPANQKTQTLNEQAILNMSNKQVIENLDAIKSFIAGR